MLCRYEVAVRDRITGNPLGGPAVHLTLLPADLNPRMSSFHIRGWEVTGGRPTVSAGADMQLTLAIYDVYGNAGRVREENIVAHASGKPPSSLFVFSVFSFCFLPRHCVSFRHCVVLSCCVVSCRLLASAAFPPPLSPLHHCHRLVIDKVIDY
jgi:hypothetical protein